MNSSKTSRCQDHQDDRFGPTARPQCPYYHGNDLLHSGVDTKTLRVWLGHVSLQTTQIYAESDLKMKAKALATSLCSIIQ